MSSGTYECRSCSFSEPCFLWRVVTAGRIGTSDRVLKLSPQLSADEFAALLTRRVAFLPSVPEPPMQSAKMNRSEAKIVAGLAAAVYRQYTFAEGRFSAASTLGVITPYRSQIALIKKEIEALGIPALNEILVDTVERFQEANAMSSFTLSV